MTRRRLAISLSALLVVAFVAALWFWPPGSGEEPPPDEPAPVASTTPPEPQPARSTDEAEENTVEGSVSSDGLLLEHPLGAVLDIEPGDLPVGTTVSLGTTSTPLRDLIDDLQVSPAAVRGGRESHRPVGR